MREEDDELLGGGELLLTHPKNMLLLKFNRCHKLLFTLFERWFIFFLFYQF